MAKPLRIRCQRSAGGVVRSMVGIGGRSSFTSCDGLGVIVITSGLLGIAGMVDGGDCNEVVVFNLIGDVVSSADNCSGWSARARSGADSKLVSRMQDRMLRKACRGERVIVRCIGWVGCVLRLMTRQGAEEGCEC